MSPEQIELAERGPSSLTDLRRIITALDTQRSELREAGDLNSLAYGLAQVRALMADLRYIAELVETDVADLMPDRNVDIDGLGRIERRKATDRKSWDWDQLLPRLIRLAIDPDGTGELLDGADLMEAMKGIITDVIGVTPSKSPRITALRAQGIDPDEYAETKPGKSSVQIHGTAS